MTCKEASRLMGNGSWQREETEKALEEHMTTCQGCMDRLGVPYTRTYYPKVTSVPPRKD